LNKKNNSSDGESCVFTELLGETLRPGGLELTTRLAAMADIKADQRVLDIGCGKGTTAAFLARQYACRVTGVDLSDQMVSSSQARVIERNITDQVSFMVADGEYLPFNDSSFDIVISECTFSLMPDRERAATEIRRVLKPEGRFIFTDIILRGKVDPHLQSQMAFPCCLTNSASIEDYLRLFKKSGFDPYFVEDQSDQLKDISFRLGLALGDPGQWANHMLEGPCRIKGGMSSVNSSELLWDFLKQGRPGYAVVLMNKTMV
jgi:arsenite methyltransferase